METTTAPSTDDTMSTLFGINETAPNLPTTEFHTTVVNHVVPPPSTYPCQRLPLYVDFELIGLENIISPRGYQAYWCHGACSYPLGQEVNPSNHATVQSFAHHMGLFSSSSPTGDDEEALGGKSFPPVPVAAPCCVPSGLLSVSILFYGEDGNVALRSYDDMVAAGCSCQ